MLRPDYPPGVIDCEPCECGGLWIGSIHCIVARRHTWIPGFPNDGIGDQTHRPMWVVEMQAKNEQHPV